MLVIVDHGDTQHFAPTEECVISHAEIEELVQLAKLAEGRKASRKRPSSQRNPTNQTDPCSRRLGEFKTTIQDVLARYGTMQNSSISVSEYKLMKAQQEQELTELLRRVDNFEREVEQRFRAEIERLRNSLQKLQRRLNDNLRLLEQERAAGRRAQEALCVGYIQIGNVEEAVKAYRALNGSYEIARLTNDAFVVDGDTVTPLVNFFEALREDAQAFGTIAGYEILYSKIEQNNQLNKDRSSKLFFSLVGLEYYYSEQADINRIGALRVKLIDKLKSLDRETR
uniref:Uncharacterized protein n=1 Tax=Anopheles farauti TaxID=69004 RepID=A0A182QE21_9DIPT